MNIENVTRIEVIGEGSRQLVKWNVSNVTASLQDADRTLKIFYTYDEPLMKRTTVDRRKRYVYNERRWPHETHSSKKESKEKAVFILILFCMLASIYTLFI